MSRTFPMALVSLVVASFVAPPSASLHCNGVVTQVDAGPETFYFDDRSTPTTPLDKWLYQESNGLEGLQSGGEIIILEEPIFPAILDPCNHSNPDKLLY